MKSMEYNYEWLCNAVQGSTYSVAWQPGASKTITWASGFCQSVLQTTSWYDKFYTLEIGQVNFMDMLSAVHSVDLTNL